MKDKWIIVDLDGTLANVDHRRHFVEGDNHDWDAFYQACVNDTPNTLVVDIMHWMSAAHSTTVQIFSGRSDVVQSQTEDWLWQHGIRYDHIRMREDGNYTPDDKLKRFWYWEQFAAGDVVLVLDDRDKVVKMWRSLGLECWQVADGDF